MKRYGLLISLLVICSGCIAAAPAVIEGYQTYSLGKGGVMAVEAMKPIEYKEEMAIGGALAIQVFNRFGGPYQNKTLQTYVTTLGQALVNVSDRPGINYYFAILNTEEPNAFATPGGYVFLSRGLLKLLRNEAELAAVLGHEIAHVSHRHALRALERNKKLAGLGSLTIGAMGADPELFNKVIEEAAENLFSHGLDKDFEYEADEVGTDYAFRLGYHPEGLKNFLTVLNARSGHESIFWSTHPSPQDRLNNLSQKMNAFNSGLSYPVFAAEYTQQVQGQL